MAGKGWIIVNKTTFKINIKPGRDINQSRKAYQPKFNYATRDASWFWEDAPTASRRRLRVHLTVRLLIASGIPYVEMPSVAVHRYLGCIGRHTRSFQQLQPQSEWAWLELVKKRSWRYDRKYPRVR